VLGNLPGTWGFKGEGIPQFAEVPAQDDEISCGIRCLAYLEFFLQALGETAESEEIRWPFPIRELELHETANRIDDLTRERNYTFLDRGVGTNSP